MLDWLVGTADAEHTCGYETAVLGGVATLVQPVSACCASLGEAKVALDAVDRVIWGIRSVVSVWTLARTATRAARSAFSNHIVTLLTLDSELRVRGGPTKGPHCGQSEFRHCDRFVHDTKVRSAPTWLVYTYRWVCGRVGTRRFHG